MRSATAQERAPNRGSRPALRGQRFEKNETATIVLRFESEHGTDSRPAVPVAVVARRGEARGRVATSASVVFGRGVFGSGTGWVGEAQPIPAAAVAPSCCKKELPN